MQKIKVWIYRPDKANRVNLSLLESPGGQNYYDWKRDEETLYREKIESVKDKIREKPVHKVYDYWR